MNDYIIRATAGNNQIRAFACTTRNLVEHARKIHNTSPVITAALGRLLSAGAMMGSMMKGEKDILTLQIRGNGPAKGLVVTSDSKSNLNGYAYVPNVILPANDKCKLDVAGALGIGLLSVTRDMGMKEPYSSQTNLTTSEIAEDLTYYFATSEQVPSAVGLGVLMNKDNTVRQAGGFIIQLMPNASDEIIDILEENIRNITSVSELLDKGMTPEEILENIIGNLGLEITEKIPTQYNCNCSKERVTKALISIGEKDIKDMIEDEEDIEMNCHFCSSKYNFSVDDLKELL